MKKFVHWHKDRIACVAKHFGLSQYQLLWVATVKGIICGYIVGTYL